MELEKSSGDSNYLELIEKIKQAFADVPHPGDENIIGSPEHVKICDECREIEKEFTGKTWNDLLEAGGWHGIEFISPSALHYFLPGYLISWIQRGVFGSFGPNTPQEREELKTYWQERAEQLSAEQCQVLLAYLYISLEMDKKEWGDDDDLVVKWDLAAIAFWEERLRTISSEREKPA